MSKKPDVFSANVVSMGRVTIPDELRNLYNIDYGKIVTLKIVSVCEPTPRQ